MTETENSVRCEEILSERRTLSPIFIFVSLEPGRFWLLSNEKERILLLPHERLV